jgi:hypothetical protein
MKKFILIVILSFIFSSPILGDWEFFRSSEEGTGSYIDYSRIKEHNGYIYFWVLTNLYEPDSDGDLSYTGYREGDCKIFRFKVLTEIYHKVPMGEDIGRRNTTNKPNWFYPKPGSVNEAVLENVCKYIK